MGYFILSHPVCTHCRLLLLLTGLQVDDDHDDSDDVTQIKVDTKSNTAIAEQSASHSNVSGYLKRRVDVLFSFLLKSTM